MLYKEATILLGLSHIETDNLLQGYKKDLLKAENDEKKQLVTEWFELKLANMAKNIMCKNPEASDNYKKAKQVYDAFYHQPPLSEFDRNYSEFDGHVRPGCDCEENKHPALGHGLYQILPMFSINIYPFLTYL